MKINDQVFLIRYRVTQKRRGLLHAAGYNGETLGRELGVTRAMISYVINDHRRTEWIRRGIVHLIGDDYREFWGQEPRELRERDRKKLKALGLAEVAKSEWSG